MSTLIWFILTKLNLLALFVNKYGPRAKWFEGEVVSCGSLMWISIVTCVDVLRKGLCFSVGDVLHSSP